MPLAAILPDHNFRFSPSASGHKLDRNPTHASLNPPAPDIGDIMQAKRAECSDIGPGEAHTSSLVQEPIAICGIALRLPGGVRTPFEFWELLIDGRDAKAFMTKDRAQSPGLHHKDCPPVGYYLGDNLSAFDPSLFKITRTELEQADPQQRLLLQVTRECLESAGEVNYKGRNVGCYIGTFGDEWMQLLSKDDQAIGGIDFRGVIDTILANRISYEFGFRGPRYVWKWFGGIILT